MKRRKVNIQLNPPSPGRSIPATETQTQTGSESFPTSVHPRAPRATKEPADEERHLSFLLNDQLTPSTQQKHNINRCRDAPELLLSGPSPTLTACSVPDTRPRGLPGAGLPAAPARSQGQAHEAKHCGRAELSEPRLLKRRGAQRGCSLVVPHLSSSCDGLGVGTTEMRRTRSVARKTTGDQTVS